MTTKDFIEGKSKEAYKFFGPQKNKNSHMFRLFAPSCKKAYLFGDFNSWEKQPMTKYPTGLFSTKVKNLKEGDNYKYILEDENSNTVEKLDPFARKLSPDKSASVFTKGAYKFKYKNVFNKDLDIYQVYLKKLVEKSTSYIDFEKVSENLIGHMKENGFNAIMLLDLLNSGEDLFCKDHINLFAINDKIKDPSYVKKFIDTCHKNKISVIVDINFGNFSSLDLGLRDFDGTRIFDYDYDDIHRNYEGLVNYDFSKNTTKSYIMSALNYRAKEFNIDIISFASLENILYRQADANRGYNQKAIEFLKEILENIKSLKIKSIADFDKNCLEELDLDFDYYINGDLSKIVKIFQKYPDQRRKYMVDIEKFLKNDYQDQILGLTFLDSYTEEASACMKMYSDDFKLEQFLSLLILLHLVKSNKIIFMGDEFASLENLKTRENILALYNKEDFFNIKYKSIKNILKQFKDSKNKLVDIEGENIFAIKKENDREEILLIINLSDKKYKIANLKNYDFIFSTNMKNRQERKEKEINIIEAYSSKIYKRAKK